MANTAIAHHPTRGLQDVITIGPPPLETGRRPEMSHLMNFKSPSYGGGWLNQEKKTHLAKYNACVVTLDVCRDTDPASRWSVARSWHPLRVNN